MEKPVQLKPTCKTKEIQLSTNIGKECIVHFQSTVNEEVQLLTDKGFQKLQDVAKTRLGYQSSKYKYEHISQNLPEKYDVERHGTHKRCYQLFTNLSHVPKREHSSDNICDTPPSSSKRMRSTPDATCSLLLFPADKCIFCDKNAIKNKGCKQALTKCVTKCAEESIKLAANEKSDQRILRKVQGQDLVAREAMYHNVCRRNYTRSGTRHESHEGSFSFIQQKVHKTAFKFICDYIEEHIVLGHNVERLTMLKERYLSFILEHHPTEYNENYKTYKLKDKLSKHFGDRIRFWQPTSCNTTSELVYGAGVEGSAVEKAFELASSDERRLAESALILRRCVIEDNQNSTSMPWPPSASWLLSGERKPPEKLVNFFVNLISAKPSVPKRVSSKVKRYATSYAEDVCYAVTNGEWLMPKHILLPMTVRHLTGNAELITILNRFGHAQSYTRTMELETAMCNAVVNSPTTLPPNITTENNGVIHFCWDNFDLCEETLSGAGTTHSTHGIVLQEIADTSIATKVESYQVPKSGERTVKPKELYIRPCFARSKVEPCIATQRRKPDCILRSADLNTVIWSLCRVLGSQFEYQTVPSITGWLSKTAIANESVQTTVEYMPPLNVSINETSTVQHILETSIAASQEAGQIYTIVTFDLAVAKKAYSLCWQFNDQFNNVIVRMGVFHTICSLFSTLGKMLKGSGFAEIVIESGICASGSLEKVMSGKHYNRALRVHKLITEGLGRLLLKRFEEQHPQTELLGEETRNNLHDLANDPDHDKLSKVAVSDDIQEYFQYFNNFKDTIRTGSMGKTAQFWLQYMDIIHMILTLIRATKENDLKLHVAALYNLCPLYFAFDHHNYARYVPAYLMTLMNLTTSHPGATELLQNNGISVCRSSVPKSRNPVDITIEQTINRHAKCQGGIIGFSRNYSAYYRWSTTRHFRAQYVEAILQTTDIVSEESSIHKELQPSQLYDSELSVQKVIDAVSNFTNPFDVESMLNNQLYCLSSGVPARPESTDNLLRATDIGREAMESFITDRLVEKKVSFHDPIKRNKLKTFATSEVSTSIKGSNNKLAQIKAERNIFAQLVLLAVQNDIDLEQTLSYPLGPVPWSLATADGMPVKTNKAKLLHYIETGIELTTIRPAHHVAHVIDGNAVLQSIVSVPNTFEEVAEMVFDQLPKTGRVDFVTDTYKDASIKSLERNRRGTSPTFLLSGAKTKTPRDWKSFMNNSHNKTQLLNLLLEQWSLNKYAEKLRNRLVYFVLGEKCCQLTSHDGETVEVLPEESLYSSQEEADTRIILHCLQIKQTDAETIVVRSPDTDVIVLLVKYWSQIGCSVLFDTGTGNKRRLVDVEKIVNAKGENFCAVLPAIHCFTGCDTVSAFVRKGKIGPVKLLQKHPEYLPIFAKLGETTEVTDEVMSELEHFVCCMYGKPKYTNVNKLRFETFCKKSDIKGNTLSSCNSIDMSLLPPCRSSLKMHIQRTNYQVYLWLHAHERYPITPEVEQNGWRFGNEGIECAWNDGNIVPSELIDILCNAENEQITDDDTNDEDEDTVEIENTLDEVFDDE